MAAWGEPELDLDADQNGLAEDGLDGEEAGGDEDGGGWDMEVCCS